MIFIRSTIFNIYYILGTFLIALFFLPFSGEGNYKAGRFWSHYMLFGLKYICNIRLHIEGKENLPQGAYIIASKHQSAWETTIFFALFPRPIYILKQELLKLPVFGRYLRFMGMIAIDRSKKIQAMKKVISESKDRLQRGFNLIIFPEGTRVKYGSKAKIQSGIISLYNNGLGPIIPLSLDSGKCWAKNSWLKYPGIINVKIFPPIPEGLNKDEFTELLSKKIDFLDNLKI
jgi:1-acyl-sn-glycerol-3-phosphate acyltransferase